MEIQMKKGKFRCTTLGDYSVLKTLGEGATAKIKLGQDKNGKQWALKILKSKWNLEEDGIKNEVEVLKQISHPNIINVQDVQVNACQTKPSGKTSKKTFIVLELAEGGEVIDYLLQTGAFSDQTCRYYMKQLCGALKVTHDAGFAHRDLKPDNLLYDRDFQLKVADFGFSACLDKEGDGKLYTMLGTLGYMAPEIHERKAYDGKSVDLFAAAIILFVMKSGNQPFGKATKTDGHYKLFMRKPKKFWKFHSKNKPKGFYTADFIELLTAMFSYDPSKRPNLNDVMSSKYMQGQTCERHDIVQEFQKRHATCQAEREAELQRQKMKKQGGAGYGGNKFRDVDQEVLEALDLTEVYNNLEKTYPDIKSTEREAMDHTDVGTGCNYHLIKAEIQDVFEFLVAVLTSQKKGCDYVKIDDEDFTITSNYLDEEGEVGIMLNLYQKGDHVAIEFKKTVGDQMAFFAKTKQLKEEFLNVLADHEEKKEDQQMDSPQEEQKEDN